MLGWQGVGARMMPRCPSGRHSCFAADAETRALVYGAGWGLGEGWDAVDVPHTLRGRMIFVLAQGSDGLWSRYSGFLEPFHDLGCEIPPEFMLEQAGEATEQAGEATAPQRGTEMPWPNPVLPHWADPVPGCSLSHGDACALVRPASHAQRAEQNQPTPLASRLWRGGERQASARSEPPKPSSAAKVAPTHVGTAQPVCPVCNRVAEEPHRLGMYWRKFGYKGASVPGLLPLCLV